MTTVQVRTTSRIEFVDITRQVNDAVSKTGVQNGVVVVYVPHTTAGVTINEAADPSVVQDINTKLTQVIPHQGPYRHVEGNSDAHIKASLVGSSVTVIISDGALVLGTWQGIFFCEFDGPRSRKFHFQVMSQ